MDWVHCNHCFILPDSEKRFFLTSCGHIYCVDCESQCARNRCKLCGNECTTITLSSSMKPDVQIYFTDPDDLLKKKLKEIQQIHQISEFQKNHRARLMAHQKKQLKKFKTVKEDFRKLIKNLKDLDNERKKLAHENDMMKKFIAMQRTPSNNPDSTERTEKGHRTSPYDNLSPHTSINAVLSKLSDKSDKAKSHISTAQRMCVISPPMNGKLGVIPSTPSPSSCFKKLSLSAISNESSHVKNTPQFMTPSSTPGSICDKYGSSYNTPQSSQSIDPYSPDYPPKNVAYKRDVRKLVVHPYSPED